jgi:hypothetical protein
MYRGTSAASGARTMMFHARKLAPSPPYRNMLPFEVPSFYCKKGKSYIEVSIIYYDRTLKRYAGQNEVRFKVTDRNKRMYDETAHYLYEYNLMEKPNIQSFGRWCMDYVCKMYRVSVIESKIMKQREQRQKQMQQPPPLSYPAYYSGNQTWPF